MIADSIPSRPCVARMFTVNGRPTEVFVEATSTLLEVLRTELSMTGTKQGCDLGACGACTVIADGRRIVSCLALAASYERSDITTIEGLGTLDCLHPLQDAFIRHDALQCGYCTPGQILSGVAVLADNPADRAAIREAMSGNLCRCGAYPKIVAAIAELAGL